MPAIATQSINPTLHHHHTQRWQRAALRRAALTILLAIARAHNTASNQRSANVEHWCVSPRLIGDSEAF